MLIPHVILTALKGKSGLVEVKMQQTEFSQQNLSVVVLMRMPWIATKFYNFSKKDRRNCQLLQE